MNAWHRAGRSIGRRVAALATLVLLIGGIPSAQASPGDLDTGFSSDGKVLTDIGTADSGRAVAIQADGKVVVAGSASSSATATPRTTPGQPGSLSATEGTAQVDLSWSDPSSDGGSAVTGYKVEQSTDSGLTWATVVADTGSTSTSHTVTSLVNGTSYSFRVAAVNAAGTGATSSTVTATPRSTSDAPTGLSGTPGDQQVALAWSAPSDSGGSAVTGYRVEQSADGGSDWSTVVADTGSTSTNYTVTGLANGSMYAFRVAAVNVAGTGGTSSTASETPRTTPGRPIGVVPEDGDAQSALTWTAPTSAGGAAVTGFLVEQSSDGGDDLVHGGRRHRVDLDRLHGDLAGQWNRIPVPGLGRQRRRHG